MGSVESEMETAPTRRHGGSGGSLELVSLLFVGTLAIAVAVLLRVSWKHLRARGVPADAPIVLE